MRKYSLWWRHFLASAPKNGLVVGQLHPSLTDISSHCVQLFIYFSIRLAKLIENQPKKNKKSMRCLLHSLDSQRSRPITPVWRDVWDCMKPDCKKDVCIIEASSLHATLETYLRKHRFCAECRTKVLKGTYVFFIPGKDKFLLDYHDINLLEYLEINKL